MLQRGRILASIESLMSKIIANIILSFFALNLCAANFTEMFKERAKCVVAIKYSVELEEDRQQIFTSGILVNKDGLVVLPSTEIPTINPKCLKDFKAYIEGGNEDGYPMTFLGEDNVTGVKYLRIKGGAPSGMRPYSDFEKGVFEIGEQIWGVAIENEVLSFQTACLRGYVSSKDFRPLEMGVSQAPVSGLGAPVFNAEGKMVAWALGDASFGRVLIFKDGRAQVSILQNGVSNLFLTMEEFEKIIKRIPSDPSGDPCGWMGIVGLQVLKKDVSKFLGLNDKCGLVVSDIITGAPADKAGLKKGDIIIGLNGKNLQRLKSDQASQDYFTMKLRETKPKDTVTLKIVRDAKAPQEVKVTMADSPKDVRKCEIKYFKRLGFSVTEFTMGEAIGRRMLDVKVPDAAIVRFVKPNSPASSATPSALRRGDLIKEINSKPVKSFADAVKIFQSLNDDEKVKELVILAEDYRETKVVRIKID